MATHDKILIFLHPDEDTLNRASWIMIDEFDILTHRVADGDLTQLHLDDPHDIFVFVPTNDVLLTSVSLPRLSRQRLQQAIPFALEEQLVDDVNHLHFAIGNEQLDGSFPIAVVSHQKMLAWIHLFESLHLAPQAFIPTVFLLPWSENQWTINIYKNHCLIRTGKFTGFAALKENLDTLLQLYRNEHSLDPATTHPPLQTEFSELALLEKVGNHFTTLPFINLLQHTYQPKPKNRTTKKIWRMTCYLALAWIVFLFIGNLVSYFILNHENKQVEAAINAIYYQHFPNATAVVAPKERMNSKLHALSGEENSSSLFGLLAIVGKSLSETSGVHIRNLEFHTPQLTLEMIAISFDQLDKFKHALLQRHLNVKQQNAETEGEEVKATFLIRAGTV